MFVRKHLEIKIIVVYRHQKLEYVTLAERDVSFSINTLELSIIHVSHPAPGLIH